MSSEFIFSFPAVAALAAALLAASPLESRATVEDEVAKSLAAVAGLDHDANRISFPAQEARFVRVAIHRSRGAAVGIDELEVFGPDSRENLALASRGAKASASSVITGHAIHSIAHLNDGLYGNDHSWIAGGEGEEWAQIELPAPAQVSSVAVSRDREGKFTDRPIVAGEILLSADGQAWRSAAKISGRAGAPASLTFPVADLSRPDWTGLVEYAFLRERDTWGRMDATDYLSPLLNDRPALPGGAPYWGRLARMPALERALTQFGDMITRLSAEGLSTEVEQKELADLRAKASASPGKAEADALYLAARHAKRRLFFRDPKLAPLERVLFAKRHPLKPSHNYSDHLDSIFVPGGGVCVLQVPRDAEGRLDPAKAEVRTLFDGSNGIVRHTAADYDGKTIYFAYRPDKPAVDGWQSYWRLMSVRDDGSGLRRLREEEPFHDFDPVPLPDGGLAFMSTRCTSRFLCWRPQAYVLHRMERDGSGLRRLSFANLSEWDPAVLKDGRILWTRSEYLDKGADFGHTLWAIRPDGTHPEVVFGNNTPYGYGHGREMPGTHEVVCTIMSHGDHQGPIALVDLTRGPYDTAAITSITPDTRPQYQMGRAYSETFRDPEPVSRDHVLVSHNPGRGDHWSLYVIDRYGNRELLYLDPAISSKSPSPLRARPRPPVFPDASDAQLAKADLGLFTVQDVYDGLGSGVARGRARYIQVSQEIPPLLDLLPSGEYRSDHPPFQDLYASPVHLVHGPPRSFLTRTSNAMQPHSFRTGSAVPAEGGGVTVTERSGWPSYVAKAVLGTARVGEDGSASFTAPAGRTLYFQLLDENFNEIQRMRSVVQLQPGERRSCVGCHDDRTVAPSRRAGPTRAPPVQALTPPPWGVEPFDYERVVQPILNANCVRCHDGQKAKLDLRGQRDDQRVPASYRALIAGGWVDFFDCVYGSRHFKAEPLSFGTLRSRLFAALATESHKPVSLKPDEMRALKAWIDLNCPLWPDYRYRPERPQ